MNKTPFDKIVTNLFFGHSHTGLAFDWQLLQTFVGTLQIKYLHMYESSARFWNLDRNRMPQNQTTDIVEEIDNNLMAKINYFSFLEELNRYGRLFENKHKKIIPYYYRIRFFRNKLIEHWDDYSEFLSNINTIKIEPNKLVIPYHTGRWGGSITEIPNLRKAFLDHDLTVNLQMEDHPQNPNYSEKIYRSLENRDMELKSKEIPEDLVNAIFEYGFPTPIHDLEDYIEKLIKWIESLPNPPCINR